MLLIAMAVVLAPAAVLLVPEASQVRACSPCPSADRLEDKARALPAPVEVRAATHPGFGRLVFEWPMEIDVKAEARGSTFTLRFPRPFIADLTPAVERLGDYITRLSRKQADAISITLRSGVGARLTQIEPRIVMVEFGQSPRFTSEVDVRTGSHETFERLVFAWRDAVGFAWRRDGSHLVLDFDRGGQIDTSLLVDQLPSVLAAADTDPGLSSTRVHLVLKPGTEASVSKLGDDRVVIDLTTGDSTGADAGPDREAMRIVDPEGSDQPITLAVSTLAEPVIGPRAVQAQTLADLVAGQAGPAADSVPAVFLGEDTEPELEALNRVLVEAGGLLLPEWSAEVAPSFEYTHRGANGLVITEVDGMRRVTAQDVRRDTLKAALALRLGLPWDLQAEVRVPYVLDQERVSIGGVEQENHSGTGLGDVEVALTHQLFRERGVVPDLLAELRWKAPTGNDSFAAGSNELAVGSGFHSISGALTAVKSYDPLVFFGSLSYTANLSDEKHGFDVDPGDSVAFNIGTILSAGPGASLRLGIGQSFTGQAKVEGREIAGSDEVSGLFSVGASVALPWRTLLDVSAGIGITEDAPDLNLKLSLPYRF